MDSGHTYRCLTFLLVSSMRVEGDANLIDMNSIEFYSFENTKGTDLCEGHPPNWRFPKQMNERTINRCIYYDWDFTKTMWLSDSHYLSHVTFRHIMHTRFAKVPQCQIYNKILNLTGVFFVFLYTCRCCVLESLHRESC